MKHIIIGSIIFLSTFMSFGQMSNITDTTKINLPKDVKFNYKQLIIPSILIGYGFIGLESDQLKGYNLDIRNEIVEDIDKKITIDDFLQYSPAFSVYVLNNIGIKGKNNLKNRSVILATSMFMVFSTVSALKKITHIERPDGSANNSFPSGHTALAFAGAEFLYHEFKEKSIWYGIAGYTAASATGAFRVYNNKHWLTDVAAGAGIGILSTKFAYLINPFINKKILKSKSNKVSALFSPYYDGKKMGGAFVMTF